MITSIATAAGAAYALPGATGQSAYQVAVANGYTGTLQQWLASLVGPEGPVSTVPGPQGEQGPAGTLASYLSKSAAYAANNGDYIDANTSGGSFPITLPATPQLGTFVTIADLEGTWGTNPLDVDPGPNTIAGQSGLCIFDVANAKAELVWRGGAIGWAINPLAPAANGSALFLTLANLLAVLAELPTTDPGTGGLWLNNGVLTVSQ